LDFDEVRKNVVWKIFAGYNGEEYRMEEIFQKILDNGFSDIAGLRADASIPVSQALINEIIEAALRGNKTIKTFEVSVHEQNRVSVRLKTNLLPWSMNLKLKLDRSVDFASYSAPKMRVWLENHHLMASLGSLLNALPEWATLYGSQVVIDLGAFFHTMEQKRLFALVKAIDIRTVEGKAIFDLKIEVD